MFFSLKTKLGDGQRKGRRLLLLVLGDSYKIILPLKLCTCYTDKNVFKPLSPKKIKTHKSNNYKDYLTRSHWDLGKPVK